MPRMLGPITTDRWEREVRRQLSLQLPNDWTVVCNVSWSVRDASGRVRDGQSDFVVLVPGHGMVIAEVKGSREVRVGDDGVWYRREYARNGERQHSEVSLEESPADQATKNMHALARIVAGELGRGSFPGTYAYLVIYPNGTVTSQSSMLDPTTVVSQGTILQLASRLRASLIARGSESVGNAFSLDVCTLVGKILSKQGFVLTAVDTELDVREDEDSIDQLTRQQFAALRGAFEIGRVAIMGPAGSGKTMLAIWKLRALLEEGKRVIYVCFNKALAEHLRNKHPDCVDSITSVDRFFHGIANPDRIHSREDDFFAELLPQMVLDVALTLPREKKYDAILVDEGQDFGDSRLIALLELLRDPDSQWMFFADWNQNVYNRQTDSPLGAEVVFRLYHNCRNTEKVTEAANRYCTMEVLPMPGTPLGERPLLEVRANRDAMARRALELVHELQPEGGAAILSPYRLENSCMAGHTRAYGLELTQELALLGTKGYVYFSTIKSFKGLEASQIVLVDAEAPGTTSFSYDDLYVGCTRSRSRLAIICGTEASCKWYSARR